MYVVVYGYVITCKLLGYIVKAKIVGVKEQVLFLVEVKSQGLLIVVADHSTVSTPRAGLLNG